MAISRTAIIFGRMFLPKVKNLMTRDFTTIDGSASLQDAFQVVMEDGVHSVIITREGKPAGILTRRDLLGQCLFQRDYTEKTTVENFMSHPLITIDSNENALKAYELMMQKKIGRLVVLEDGKIVGTIRLDHIRHLAEKAPVTVFYRVGYFLLGTLATTVVFMIALAL